MVRSPVLNWNFGDGTNSIQADTQHTYSQSGTYAARLIVTDNDGAQDTASVQVKAIVLNQPPVAVAVATPDSGVAPLVVQFTGSGSSDVDGPLSSFLWIFGDSDSSTAVDPIHTYLTTGIYSASLIVTDQQSQKDTIDLSIKVVAGNQTVIRVNNAGPEYSTVIGKIFSEDQEYSSGSWGYLDDGRDRSSDSTVFQYTGFATLSDPTC